MRDKLSIILRCPSGLQRRRGVHDFVPLFFNPIVPMLYACKAWSLRIVAIEITPDILENPLVLFSDGNVSMQQMRSRPGWHTDIYVSCDGSPCRRRHRQDGWDKTGSSRPASNIYHGLEHLECLRWDIITATSWAGRFGTPADPDARRLRSAEVLVPREVSVAAFRRIVVGNPRARFEAAAEVHAVGMDIPVEIDPRFRWPNWSSVLETDGEQFYGSELPRR